MLAQWLTLHTAGSSSSRGQPGPQFRRLRLGPLRTGGNALERLLQRALRIRHLVCVEELPHVVARSRVAERAERRNNDGIADEFASFLLNLSPALLDHLPGEHVDAWVG